ncbi:O-antigen ligase family protein [Terriglobus albidus]|uniref:O-antigen ligase family protein n=1 Tax=Terriglobus albidus TaxID=1592106 RepID=A0A5B9EDZ1_9BACT|nr:O-antigen ligase family protein [Terriglobus albidus]QEE28611.1 O-antigen ligase family protein [Terriglobus albidus]
MILVDLNPQTTIGVRSIALYGSVVLGALLTLAWRSEIGIYILSVLLPLQTTRYHLHAFPLGSNIVDILLLCVFIGTVIRPPSKLAYRPRIAIFLVCIAIFYFLSLWRGAFYLGGELPIWFSDHRLVDYKNFIVMPLLAFAVVRAIRTKRQIVTIIILCGLTSVAVDYSYLKSSFGRDFTHYSEETRDAGPLGYAGENGLASYLVEATAFVLPLIVIKKNPRLRLFALTVAVANTVCLLFSYSREAYLALAVILCFLAVVRVRALFIPILLLAIGWQAILPLAVRERIAMTYSRSDVSMEAELDASAQERVMLWSDAMVLFRENPVFGTGFLTYAELSRVGSYKDTHNFYLKMLVETGLVGLCLFILQLLLLLREGMRLFTRARDSLLSLIGLGYAAMIVAATIVNLFGDRWMFIQVDSNLWILLGCVICGSSLTAESRKQLQHPQAASIAKAPWAIPAASLTDEKVMS